MLRNSTTCVQNYDSDYVPIFFSSWRGNGQHHANKKSFSFCVVVVIVFCVIILIFVALPCLFPSLYATNRILFLQIINSKCWLGLKMNLACKDACKQLWASERMFIHSTLSVDRSVIYHPRAIHFALWSFQFLCETIFECETEMYITIFQYITMS